MSFNENLKIAMKVREVSTDDLMEEIGTPRAVISSYRTRRRLPKWYRAIDIADALDVSLDWLTDRDYHNNQKKENTPMSTLVRELAELCDFKTRRDIYTNVGMGSATLNNIMHDDDVDLTSVIKIADYFDVSLDFLAGRGPQKFITQDDINEYLENHYDG